MSQIVYDLESIPHQKKFHFSTKPKVYLSTGFGGGKTYSLVMKMFDLMNRNPGVAGGLLVPNLKMYKRDVLPTIYEIIRDNGIRYRYNKSEFHWLFAATQSQIFVFHSEDDGQSIRGPNLGWFAINEVTLCSQAAFLACLSRVRDKRARNPQIVMSGTPEGFNWTYNYFVEDPRSDTDLIFGDARENSFVHEAYFSELEGSYDEKMQAMYIGGQFINLTGNRAVYSFDRRRHTSVKAKYDPQREVLVHLDFNVNPLAAGLCHRINQMDRTGKKTQKLVIFDEVSLQGSNTQELCDYLKHKFGFQAYETVTGISIYPDPSGASRSTKSNHTDLDILELNGFKDIRYKRAPSVRDSLNALNKMFERNEILINPKCKNLIADMEQCILKNNDFSIDKSDPKRTHWLDGLRYLVDYEFPVYKRRPARTATYL